jgi:NADH-quinone oxidoreductase subunit J
MSVPLFLVLAVLTIASALVVVVHRSPIYSALGLVGTLFLLAVFFIGLDAHMVAVLQIIVYAGAIVVLFLFVIMLLNLQVEERSTVSPSLFGVALAGGVALGGLTLLGIIRTPLGAPVPVHAGFGRTEPLAERLFTVWLLPFELTSLLLLVAIVGAVVVAKKHLGK